jgi:hypothetical protein
MARVITLTGLRGIGALEHPRLSRGYDYCQPPEDAKQAGDFEPVSGGWQAARLESASSPDMLYYEYMSEDGSEVFWACRKKMSTGMKVFFGFGIGVCVLGLATMFIPRRR